MHATNGTIGWVDLTVADAPQLRVFYEAVAGWSSSELAMDGYADYTMYPPGAKAPVAGVCHARGPNEGLPPQWLMYVNVDALDERLRACEALGGRVVYGIRHMGAYGRMAVVQDPAGAVMALMEAPPRGDEAAGTPSLLTSLGPPDPGDYPDYCIPYVQKAADAAWQAMLLAPVPEAASLARRLDERQGDARYAPGKWSVKEVLGHMIDTEQVFAYRALSIARGDDAPLPGFDQDAYVAAGGFSARSLASLADAFTATRASTLALFGGFDEAAWDRRGQANGLTFSVRAIAHIVAGHEAHHLAVLRDRYALTC